MMSKNRSWFSMSKKSDDLAEIEIFDEIDPFFGIGPKEFKDRLDEIKGAKSIKLLMNSPGGNVFDGMAIYNILGSVKDKLDVEVIGLAASVSSIIALAGRSMKVAEGAYFMIHNPYTLTIGGASDLRKTADLLDTMKGEFVSIYSKKSGLDEKQVGKMMDDETWLTAKESVDMGFAEGVEDYGDIAAKASPLMLSKYGFAHVPQMLADDGEKKKVTTPRELENVLRDAGFSKKEAVAIASQGFKVIDQRDSESERGEPVLEIPKPKSAEWLKACMDADCALSGNASLIEKGE